MQQDTCEIILKASWDRGVYEGEWLIRQFHDAFGATQSETLYLTVFVDSPDDVQSLWAVYSGGQLMREVQYATPSGPWLSGRVTMELDPEARAVVNAMRADGWELVTARTDEVRGIIYGAKTVYVLRRNESG